MDVFHAYYTTLMDSSSGPNRRGRRRYKKLSITLGNEYSILYERYDVN